MRSHPSLPAIYAYFALVAGCATSPHLAQPEVPPVLRPPTGQTLYLEALATGVQIYECAQKTDLTYEWAFKAPEASLVSRSGQPLGKHYAGPTWESIDGSTVVGVIKGRDPGPKNSAIPWLLLSAEATTGVGAFGTTKSIQRVATVGGIAPAEACASSNLKQVARVPYTATYYFYR
jgi:Protein of unknown function (DUF3455)